MNEVDWTVPAGEEIDDVEDLLTEENAEEVEIPSSLLPPSAEGMSREFTIAVRAYERAQKRAGWPDMALQYAVQQDLLLTAAEELLGKVNGDIPVMEVEGNSEEARKDPLLLNTWLACLRKFPEHATIVEDTAPGQGAYLVIKR